MKKIAFILIITSFVSFAKSMEYQKNLEQRISQNLNEYEGKQKPLWLLEDIAMLELIKSPEYQELAQKKDHIEEESKAYINQLISQGKSQVDAENEALKKYYKNISKIDQQMDKMRRNNLWIPSMPGNW